MKLKETRESKELNISLKLLAKTSLIVFIGVILSKILSYFYRVIVARYLGAEIYGLYSLGLMITALFIAVSSLGILYGTLRYIPLYRGKEEWNKVKHIFKITTTILFFSSFIAGAILFFLSEPISINIFHNPSLIIFLKVFSLIIPVSIFASTFLLVLRAFEKIAWYSFIFNILSSIIQLASLILFIFIGLKAGAVIFSYVLGILGMLLAGYLVCKYQISEIWGNYTLNKNIKRQINKSFFSYSWPMLFFGVISISLYWIDSFVIGYFKNAENVGFYNAAVPIALLLNLAPELFMQLFFPLITKEYSRKKFELIKQISKQVGKWIFIINLPVFLLMILFPGAIINLLFGQNYIVAENSLRFLAIGGFFSSIFLISNNLLSAIGKSKLALLDMVIVLVINAILDIIFVQKYGITGAAFATMLSQIVLYSLFLFQAKHYLSIVPVRKKMLRIAIVMLIPLGLLLLIKQFITITIINLILIGLFFFLFYFFLILITGCLDKNDFMIINTIKKKIFRK